MVEDTENLISAGTATSWWSEPMVVLTVVFEDEHWSGLSEKKAAK